MENFNQIQNLEPGTEKKLHLDCAPPCNGAVCIPRMRYDELLNAENALGVLRRAYQTMSIYAVDHIMDAIFDPTLKYKPELFPETNVLAGGADDAE